MSLLLIPTKSRHDPSNGSTIRNLRMQEKKNPNSQNMISLDNVSFHSRCALEVEVPKLDIELTHVGKKGQIMT